MDIGGCRTIDLERKQSKEVSFHIKTSIEDSTEDRRRSFEENAQV